jgi:hypothetical protein
LFESGSWGCERLSKPSLHHGELHPGREVSSPVLDGLVELFRPIADFEGTLVWFAFTSETLAMNFCDLDSKASYNLPDGAV